MGYFLVSAGHADTPFWRRPRVFVRVNTLLLYDRKFEPPLVPLEMKRTFSQAIYAK